MDNFLRDFKEKVNRAKKPEVQPSDWELFKAYRSGESVKQKPVIPKRIPKRIIGGVAATLLIGISLFAYFTFPDKTGENDLTIEGKNMQNRNTQYELYGSDENQGSEALVLENNEVNKKELSLNTHTKNNEKIGHVENSKRSSNKVGLQSNQKNANISILNVYNTPHSDLTNTDLAQKENFLENQQKALEETDFVNSGLSIKNPGNNQFTGYENDGITELSDFSRLEIEELQRKNYSIEQNQESFDLNGSFALNQVESETLVKNHFQIGGAIHFIVPVEDRIGATFHSGKRIFGSYQINDKLSFGINWSQSAYTRTIPDKKMYPSLDEINPRSTEDQLEELTVNASFNKAGLYIHYDILRLGKLINKIGFGIQRDISSKFDFKMHVRDPLGAPKIQHQNKNIIPKSRYFITPQYQLSYAIADHVNMYADAQYDISLAPGRERYLSFDVGAAFVF